MNVHKVNSFGAEVVYREDGHILRCLMPSGVKVLYEENTRDGTVIEKYQNGDEVWFDHNGNVINVYNAKLPTKLSNIKILCQN